MPTPPTGIRGTLTAVALSRTYELLMNPAELARKKSVSWGWQEVQGADSPVPQFGTGGKDALNVTLYLDGDRMKKGRGKAEVSINEDLEFFESLVTPVIYQLGQYAAVAPPIVLVTLMRLKAVPMIVESLSIKETQHLPNGTAVKATLDLDLARAPTNSNSTLGKLLNTSGQGVSVVGGSVPTGFSGKF